jgi:hypothetical protein
MSSDIDWLGAPADPAPAASQPIPRPRAPKAKQIPFADAWLLFAVGEDGAVEGLQVTRGSHLNRLKPDAPRDWTFDIHFAAFGPDPQTAWREFCLRWHINNDQRGDAMRAVAAVEGCEWLAGQADHWDYAIGKEKAA